MRSYDEEIDVRHGRVDGEEGPAQFVWRQRLHRINRIQTHWLETAPWWEGDAVRAARGEYADVTTGSGATAVGQRSAGSLDLSGDLAGDQEVWRVEATVGRCGDDGVYELAHSWASGRWQLRRVVD